MGHTEQAIYDAIMAAIIAFEKRIWQKADALEEMTEEHYRLLGLTQEQIRIALAEEKVPTKNITEACKDPEKAARIAKFERQEIRVYVDTVVLYEALQTFALGDDKELIEMGQSSYKGFSMLSRKAIGLLATTEGEYRVRSCGKLLRSYGRLMRAVEKDDVVSRYIPGFSDIVRKDFRAAAILYRRLIDMAETELLEENAGFSSRGDFLAIPNHNPKPVMTIYRHRKAMTKLGLYKDMFANIKEAVPDVPYFDRGVVEN